MQLRIGYQQWYVSCQKFRRLFVSISRKFDGAILRLFSRVPVMITYMCTCVYVLVHSVSEFSFLFIFHCFCFVFFNANFIVLRLIIYDESCLFGIMYINCRHFSVMLPLRVRYCTVYCRFIISNDDHAIR